MKQILIIPILIGLLSIVSCTSENEKFQPIDLSTKGIEFSKVDYLIE